MVRHASFATGIGGFDLGFEQAGIESVFQCEIEPFCLKILERHWPDVPKAHDLRSLEASSIPDADVWTCGFPCQDVSVAGKRAGLRGERSNLWFDFAGLVEQRQPEWLVVENVAGLLSSNGGADMALIVGQLSSFGYGVAWRVLDSRYFGVPQRRRRVYLVGHLGDLRAAEVLFERKGSGGDSETSREAGQDVAYSLTSSVRGSGDGHGQAWNTTYAIQDVRFQDKQQGGPGWRESDESYTIDGVSQQAVAYSLTGRGPGERLESEATYLVAAPLRASDGGERGWALRADGSDTLVPTLRVGGRDNKHRAGDSSDNTPIVAVAANQRGELRTSPNHPSLTGERSAKQYAGVLAPTLTQDYRRLSGQAARTGGAILSKTPNANGVREAAGLPQRLDSPRYRALGNAVTVNVAYWLGRRIVAAQP